LYNVIEDKILINNMDDYQIILKSLEWLKKNRFVVETNEDNIINAKQRIHDMGQGLHHRNYYKNIEINITRLNSEIQLNISLNSPIILNDVDIKKARLYWMEYVYDLYRYLGIEIKNEIHKSYFSVDYYKQLINDENKLLLWLSFFNILLIWEILGNKYINAIFVIILIETILIYINFRNKNKIKKDAMKNNIIL